MNSKPPGEAANPIITLAKLSQGWCWATVQDLGLLAILAGEAFKGMT